jgi:hypothetical protein
MNPSFSVGEVVILQSKNFPECNGDATVLEYVPPGELSASGELNTHGVDGYRLDVIASNGNLWWSPSALRKKHQPGEQSFTQLMQTLKSPVSV